MGTRELLREPDRMLGRNLRWASLPSRGVAILPGRFMLQKPGLSAEDYEPVGLKKLSSQNSSVSSHLLFLAIELAMRVPNVSKAALFLNQSIRAGGVFIFLAIGRSGAVTSWYPRILSMKTLSMSVCVYFFKFGRYELDNTKASTKS